MSAQVRTFSTLGDEVAKALVSCRVDGPSVVITTPLLYPSGSHVRVRFDGDGRHFFVSDDGGAFQEADLMGGIPTFRRTCVEMAIRFHLEFDESCLFSTGIDREKLFLAVIVIANASKEAADQTAQKLSEKSYQFEDSELVERLVAIFGLPKVHRKAEYIGASNKPWTFAAAIDSNGRQTVFDLVKPRWQSVMPAVIKFRDVSDLLDAPVRVAVLSDKRAFREGDYNLLARTARVIDFRDQDEIYKRAA